jgi:hypothetical protein
VTRRWDEGGAVRQGYYKECEGCVLKLVDVALFVEAVSRPWSRRTSLRRTDQKTCSLDSSEKWMDSIIHSVDDPLSLMIGR